MADFQDNIVDNAATITANATSAAFVRPTATGTKKAILLVNIANSPTGTSPTLTYKLQSSLDGTTWHDAGSTPALSAIGTARLELFGLEPQWRVVKTVGGTTPSFTGVTSHLLFAKD